MVDYNKIDEELDDELRAMYAESSEEEPSETGETESHELNETDSEEALEEATEPESMTEEEDVEAFSESETDQSSQEAQVPESRYKSAVSAMNKAQRELAEKRKEDAARDDLIVQLQQQLQQMQQQLQEKPAARDQEPTQNSESTSSEDDLAEAQELYPEVINPLMARIKQLEGKLNAMHSDVSESKQMSVDYRQQKQNEAYNNHWAQILDKHPDTREIVQSQAYKNWYEQQPSMVRQALAQGTAGDVIAALNLFRMEYPAQRAVNTSAKETQRQDKLAAAKAVSSPNVKTSAKGKAPTKRTFTNAEINNMSIEEYREYEKEIDEAFAKGEIG